MTSRVLSEGQMITLTQFTHTHGGDSFVDIWKQKIIYITDLDAECSIVVY